MLGSALGECLGWAGLGLLPELAYGCGGVGVDGGWGVLGVALRPLFLLCCSSAHANCMQLHVQGSCMFATVAPVPGCSCMPLHLRQNWLSVPKLRGKMH